jgi:hypothetical protein
MQGSPQRALADLIARLREPMLQKWHRPAGRLFTQRLGVRQESLF